jgi:hypothetical protein
VAPGKISIASEIIALVGDTKLDNAAQTGRLRLLYDRLVAAGRDPKPPQPNPVARPAQTLR